MRRRTHWPGEFAGAANATAAMLPFALSFGFMVFGALGPPAGAVGLQAALVAMVVGAAVMAACGRSPLPTAAPSASACLLLGGAVLALRQDPALAAGTPEALALLLAATGACVLLSGLLLLVLGALRAGSLVRFVPQPVLAGFMNGVALLIVVSQVPPLLGLPAGAWESQGLRSLADWHGPAPVVALATAALVALLAWRWPRLPAPLVGLVLAGLAVALWQALDPGGVRAAGLPRIGPVEMPLPQWSTLSPLADIAGRAALWPHARTIVTTAVLLALIGALESVLALATVDQELQARSDPNRELMAVGAANLVSALLGGLPLVYLRLRAVATLAGGGRSVRSVWLGCALLALAAAVGLPLLALLPTAVVAGVVVMLAWTLVDRWTRQSVRQWWRGERGTERRLDLAVVALVCVVTLGWGFVAGVAAGVLAAMVIFIRRLNRSLVRDRFTAAQFPSRRVHAPADERELERWRPRIEVLELEGALFFGNAERLVATVESMPRGEADRPTDLIVDLRRVTTLDASGALAIARLATQLPKSGTVLRLAGLRPGDRHARALAGHGVPVVAADVRGIRVLPPPDAAAMPDAAKVTPVLAHADLDHAIEAAELAALAHAAPRRDGAELPLALCPLAQGLSPPQVERLAAHFTRRTVGAGERLFAQGDPGDAVFVLVGGSIRVCDAATGQRFVSMSPGMCFGEASVLDGGGRTADAVADEPSVVLELRADALARLQRAEPDLAALLYRNLATHLSQRLRAASAAWMRMAG